MARRTLRYRCQQCSTSAARWLGRCPACGAWNSLAEVAPAAPARRWREVDDGALTPLPTGVTELDVVLGGGLWPGSVALVVGEPGVGKSTLLLQGLSSLAASGRPVLWASAEESAAQVARRAERLGAVGDRLYLLASTDVEDVCRAVVATGAEVVVVDSLQTLGAEGAGAPGGAGQARAVLDALVALSDQRQLATVVVGHLRKDGRMAGPRAVEHMVDTVLWLEGDRHGSRRLLRAVKHRHAPSTTTGLLELGASGLHPAAPEAPPARGGPGRLTVPVWSGGRPVMVDDEASCVPSVEGRGAPRCHGLVTSRVVQLVATVEGVLGTSLSDHQVLVAALGDTPAKEPAADLAVAVALWSARCGVVLPPGTVAVGEVGLDGALRPVSALPRRLADAARLGYALAIVPEGFAGPAPRGLAVVVAEDLLEAVSRLPMAQTVGVEAPGAVPRSPVLASPGQRWCSLSAPATAPAGAPTGALRGGGTIPWWWSTTGTGR